MGEKAKNRIASLDYIRTLAIFLVLWLHNLDRVFSFTVKDMSKYSFMAQLFANFAHVLGRISVPLFLMLSGYLLLTERFDTPESVFRFWKKKLVPILFTQVIWTIVYDGCTFFFGYKSLKSFELSFGTFLRHLLGLEKQSYAHLYYITVIAGIYFVIPFLATVLQKFRLKVAIVPITVLWLLCDVAGLFNDVAPIFGWQTVSVRWEDTFLGGTYAIYVIAGYYLRTEIIPFIKSRKLEKPAKIAAACVALSLYIFSALFQMWALGYADFMVQNAFPLLPPLSASLFLLVYLLFDGKKEQKTVVLISKSSFGIYVLHYILMLETVKLIMKPLEAALGSVLTVFVLFAANFLLTFLTVVIISKLFPKVSACIFLCRK